MPNSQVHPEGWISLLIATKYEDRAKQMRAERDRQYGNIYDEADTDERWVGDLGEIVFNSWFKNEGVQGFKWILDDPVGAPDFVTAKDIRIGVKTIKRKGPPSAHYTAQITARHATEPSEHYFFMTYEIVQRRMWLLGGICRERFLQNGRYYGAGEWVHDNYRIREGHEIYNIEIAKLTPPKDWIRQVT